eukprot:CAMPEP_0119150266 /NCGR_PEP_ID=MMETSP1310-20130426/44559_1 /TAXON_ID=464262 /ORGANISM="Genus nov. species nov., Strain RCC2339" /LENGTH=159 /DNA_ID=CAMNT_0007142443 /DNA_START=68 /DNA_END=544 /DNA_ORIENTATION=+
MTLLDDLLEVLQRMSAVDLSKALRNLRPENVPVDSGMSKSALLDEFRYDIPYIGTQIVLDMLSEDTFSKVCKKYKLEPPTSPEQRTTCQIKVETAVNKEGHDKFINRLKVKLLKEVCQEVGISTAQRQPEMQAHLAEELLLNAAEGFLGLLEPTVLQKV